MKQEVAEAIIGWEDHPEVGNFEEVQGETIVGTTRWNKVMEAVYQNKVDNTFWQISWTCGLTEVQDDGPGDISVGQVKPVEKTVTTYEAV